MTIDTNPAKQHIPANFTTHRSAWRKAIELAIKNAPASSAPDEDEKAYWEHELAAFDRAFARLLDNPEPVRESADGKDDESTALRFCEDVLGDIATRLGVSAGDELPTTASRILEALDSQSATETSKLQQLRSAFHVNMLRAFPDMTHEQIAAEIARAVGTQASESMEDRPTWADIQAREKDIRDLQSTVIELRQALEGKAGKQGEPLGYITEDAVQVLKSGKGVTLTIWDVPMTEHTQAIYLAAPAQPDTQSVVPLSADLMRALNDARDLAMKNTAAARIPECGDFGAIAQNLDWALDEIKRTASAAPLADAPAEPEQPQVG